MAGASGKGSKRKGNSEGAKERLTAREEEVLEYAAKGGATKDIAHGLSAAPRTIDKHFEEIRRKLNVHTRNAAVNLYYAARIARKDSIIEEQRKEIRRLRRRLGRMKRPK